MPFYVCAFYPKKSAAANGAARIQIISATLGHVDGGTVSYR